MRLYGGHASSWQRLVEGIANFEQLDAANMNSSFSKNKELESINYKRERIFGNNFLGNVATFIPEICQGFPCVCGFWSICGLCGSIW
jgi:hypothetical protein